MNVECTQLKIQDLSRMIDDLNLILENMESRSDAGATTHGRLKYIRDYLLMEKSIEKTMLKKYGNIIIDD